MHTPIKLNAVTIVGYVTFIIGFLVIMGWVFNMLFLQPIIPNYVSMKFNTAVGFILAGVLLLLTQFNIKKYHVIASLFLASLITIVGVIPLVQTLYNFNWKFDQLFVSDVTSVNRHLPNPGHMSANTAVCFILFGLSFIGFTFKSPFIHVVSQCFLNMVTAISTIAVIGYLYGMALFYSLNYAGSMTVHTAILFFFISIAASMLHPAIGITSLFTGKRLGNTMARRLVFLTIFITLTFGVLRLESDQFVILSFKNGVAILIICFLCVGLTMLWYMVNWLNKHDTRRNETEEEAKGVNTLLEKRAKERSVKFFNMVVKFGESESKFKAAFEHSAIGMALVSLKGNWLQVNKTLCDMVGYEEHELLSLSFADISHPDDRMTYIGLPDKILNNAGNTGKIEKRYICKNGSIVWVSVNIATVTDKKSNPVYFVSQFEDITERKNSERNLKTAYEEIRNHVSNIKDIAWKQSHLIRSPLANLKGLTTLLRDNPSDVQILTYINIEMERLDKVIIEMAQDAAGSSVKKILDEKQPLFKIFD